MPDPRYSWTQPVCETCWRRFFDMSHPARLRDAVPETCCQCGESTASGIYVRVDPSAIPHPTLTK